MDRKYRNIAIVSVLVIVGVASIFLLLMDTSVPVFSVKELKDNPKAESYLDRRIQLVGHVVESNESGFLLYDPNHKEDSNYSIYVQAADVEKPAGFDVGKTVLVEGKLISMDGLWVFKATKISTKCPSKYKTEG